MQNPYSEIFRAPGAKGFAAAGFVARLPIAMAPIGIVAMLSQTHGEYWLAGAVSATYALANAFLAPQISRLVDRLGQTRIVVPTTVLSVLAFVILIAAANQHWPIWTLFVSALLAAAMPSIPAMVRAGNDPVAGVKPTLAQVLQTPKAVQLERAARNNPISGPDIAAQDLQNSAARTQALQQSVLSPADELAARRARKANFSPIADALQNAGSVDVGPLRFEAANLAQRGNNAMTRSAANKVLSFIDDNTAKAGADEGMMPIADLHTLQHDLGTIVKQANPEAINTSQALHELQPFKSAIVNTVDSIVPGYQDALRRYAQDSAPIRTSQTIGDLLNPTKATATDLNNEPVLTAARIKSVLSKDDRAPFKMTPQARQDLEDVQASIQSRNAAQRSLGPTGSPTEENRLNRLMQGGARHLGAGVGGAVGFGAGGPVGSLAGALAGHGADMLDRYAQNRIAGSVGRLLMDPNASADALERYLLLQGRRQALDSALLPVNRYGGVGSVAGLLASPSRSGGGQ